MGLSVAPKTFRSFDGGLQITSRSAPFVVATVGSTTGATIARGAGLSYAAASFGGDVISREHTANARILSLDESAGEVIVEAGARLGDVYDFLAPRGFYLPVQPGHPRITIGGCIAADVHGKNQARDGTFAALVNGLSLQHRDHGRLELEAGSPLCDLTCGGLGLTGDIVTARVRVLPIPSDRIEIQTVPLSRLEDLPEALAECGAAADLLYSWHDFTASGERFGRGFVVAGRFVAGSEHATPATRPRGSRQSSSRGNLTAETRGAGRPPFFNRLTTKPFNSLFRWSTLRRRPPRVVALYEFLFPVHDKEIYFHLFGRRGFHEQQLLIPTDRFAAFAAAIRGLCVQYRTPITLASGKLFAGTDKLLSFRGTGIAFAINYPRTAKSVTFAAAVDALCLELGARPNVMKDSRLPAAVVRQCYPGYDEFRQSLAEFDPRRRHRSELSDRLEL